MIARATWRQQAELVALVFFSNSGSISGGTASPLLSGSLLHIHPAVWRPCSSSSMWAWCWWFRYGAGGNPAGPDSVAAMPKGIVFLLGGTVVDPTSHPRAPLERKLKICSRLDGDVAACVVFSLETPSGLMWSCMSGAFGAMVLGGVVVGDGGVCFSCRSGVFLWWCVPVRRSCLCPSGSTPSILGGRG